MRAWRRLLHNSLMFGRRDFPTSTPDLPRCIEATFPVQQLISLRPLQCQQAALFSAYKRPPTEDDPEEPEDLQPVSKHGHLPRRSGSELLHRIPSLAAVEVEATREAAGAATTAALERRDQIKDLIRTVSPSDDFTKATQFVEAFFVDPAPTSRTLVRQDGAPSAENADTGFPSSAPMDVTTELESLRGELESDVGGLNEDDDGGLDQGGRQVSTLSALDEEQQEEMLAELRGLRRGSQRIVLQRLLQGGMLQADPAAKAEWEAIQRAFRPPEGFRMKVVDVNRTCKGTRSGGLYRFSAMVVVGNGEGVLGWGQGKAAEVSAAVRKAYQRACHSLFPVPRYNGHTIPEPVEAKFGRVKVVMYPKSAGRGIVASTLVRDICKMAGIHDVGVKVHGSRNPRNTVKCLFEAFDSMRTHDEILVEGGSKGKVMVAAPPGRFGRLNV